MKAFKAYDIRGVWGTDLNEEIAYRIGYFLPDILDTDTYLVGHDMRLSSDTALIRSTVLVISVRARVAWSIRTTSLWPPASSVATPIMRSIWLMSCRTCGRAT